MPVHSYKKDNNDSQTLASTYLRSEKPRMKIDPQKLQTNFIQDGLHAKSNPNTRAKAIFETVN